MPLTLVNDIELYYESHGSGDPLLLIGGLGLAVSETQPLIEALAAGHRVIAVDNRGAGRSAKPPGPYAIEQMAGDVVALAAHLGLPVLSREMHARIPRSRCMFLDGGHLIALTPRHRERLVTTVREFLSPRRPGAGE